MSAPHGALDTLRYTPYTNCMSRIKSNEAAKQKRIEVWLTRVSDFRITCREVFEDETTKDWNEDAVKSSSMRGAQREVTGYYIGEGYEPIDRWSTENVAMHGPEEGDVLESSRQFRLKPKAS